MSRLAKLAFVLAAVPVLAFAGTASATEEGQIEGGNFYRIKNITKNTGLVDPANADACDTLLYNAVLHNPGPGVVVDVRVKATLPSGTANTHTSTLTTSSINATPETTSDTATLNLSSSQSLSYVAGSTELLDANGSKMNNLPDGILQGGISIGNVRVSVQEKRFVQFKVKVSCPEVPKAVFECKVLEVDGKKFTARASATNAVIQSYTFTVKNASGVTVDTLTVPTSADSAVYNFKQSTPGTYTVNVIVKTDKGSTSVKDNCTRQIVVKEQPTTPTPPVVQGKTTLPDTGAGSLLGLFAGASALGSAGHYALRRFRG